MLRLLCGCCYDVYYIKISGVLFGVRTTTFDFLFLIYSLYRFVLNAHTVRAEKTTTTLMNA